MDQSNVGDFREQLLKVNANPDAIAKQFALAVSCILRAAINDPSNKHDAIQHLKFMLDLIERADEKILLGQLVDAATEKMTLVRSPGDFIAEPLNHVVQAALKYYLELIATDNAAAGRQSRCLDGLMQAISIYNGLKGRRRIDE